jgi:outer membrane protein W
VNTGSGGAWLSLLSRLNYNTMFELSLGAVGQVEEEMSYYTDTDVDIFAVTPLLFGIRFEIIPPESQSALKPYLSLGGGPYWISSIMVKDRVFENEVTINTKLRRGGYLGGGANFLLSDWFAVNFDVKYHFIDFNVKHENSGLEYGLGVSFLWGRFR